MSKKILVTGGAGYIGSQTCKALKAEGYEPVAYDNLSRGHAWAVQYGPLVKGDLHDTERLTRAMKEHQVSTVIHFAAYAYVGESVEKPELYYENNFGGSLSLVKAMRAAGVDNIVFSSTCATYGTPRTTSLDESHPQNPINPYGESKLMVEKLLADTCRTSALRAVCLRYFNASGADADGELGEAHEPETHLIPLALFAALGRIPEISVFGNDYDTKDGSCIRDYIHVQDLASAHVAALRELEQQNLKFECVNLGTGRGHTVFEILSQIEKSLGKKVPHRVGPRRAGDPSALVANAEKAARVLKWQARHSDLSEIIQTSAAWTQKYFKL